MSTRSILASIDAVSTSLPFGVDEYEQVNRVYGKWVREGNPSDRREVDVWTYCYVQRYFEVQSMRSSHALRSDADRLVDVTLRKLERVTYQLRQPERYTSWVSSICRNTYRTYVRTRRIRELNDPELLVSESENTGGYDVSTMYDALNTAIRHLPDFLRPIATMRFVESKSYREMAAVTGKSIPTLRSYTNRALNVLRADARVRSVFDEIRG